MHIKNELGYVLQAHFILMPFFAKAPRYFKYNPSQ